MSKDSTTVSAQVVYTKDDVEILSTKPLYQGFFKMVSYTFKHKLFSGDWSDELNREMFERGHAAVLLPYDPFHDQVVLVEQFRIGALAADCEPWQLEMVAGMIEENEVSEEVARREAHEEAGIEVNEVEKITRYLASSGGCSETLDVFVGRVESKLASGIHGLPEEGEDIRVHVVSREQAYQWVESGKIENAASIIALQWLQLNYLRLQQLWCKD